MLVRIRHPERLIYPESDGRPMGENTLQFQWIITLFHGFESLFFKRKDVFVAADLFWYPVHGDPTTSLAPDLMIVLDRPKGHRSSYKQWEEDDVAPQVVIEIQSPSNSPKTVVSKRAFYSRYGVEEFYQYDPECEDFQVWIRSGNRLRRVKDTQGFVSPRLGVRFEIQEADSLQIVRPDGLPFLTYRELITQAETQQQRIVDERARAERLAGRLRELGVDPDTV